MRNARLTCEAVLESLSQQGQGEMKIEPANFKERLGARRGSRGL